MSQVHLIEWSKKGTVYVQLFVETDFDKIVEIRDNMSVVLNGEASEIGYMNNSFIKPSYFEIKVDDEVDVNQIIADKFSRLQRKKRWSDGVKGSRWLQKVTVHNDQKRTSHRAATFPDLMESFGDPLWTDYSDLGERGAKSKHYLVAKFTNMNDETLAVLKRVSTSPTDLFSTGTWTWHPDFPDLRGLQKEMKITLYASEL